MNHLRDWVPFKFSVTRSEPLVDWCNLGLARFIEPFFEDTIAQSMRLPFNLVFQQQTSIDVLKEVANGTDIVPPTGFIFHMSRCGSTLITQMLAEFEENIVISEAPPIDSVISSRNDSASDDSVKLWLQWMVAAFGRRRSGAEKHYFIKFDAWNTLDLDLIAGVFPTVPSLFVYRNPVEVLASQLREPGMHVVPGFLEKRLPQLNVTAALEMSREEYCARILAEICEPAVARAQAGPMLLVNYEELPNAVFDRIASHFNLAFEPAEISAMLDKTRFNAKRPQLFFEADTETKKREVSDDARRVAETLVDPIYNRLEEIRLRTTA